MIKPYVRLFAAMLAACGLVACGAKAPVPPPASPGTQAVPARIPAQVRAIPVSRFKTPPLAPAYQKIRADALVAYEDILRSLREDRTINKKNTDPVNCTDFVKRGDVCYYHSGRRLYRLRRGTSTLLLENAVVSLMYIDQQHDLWCFLQNGKDEEKRYDLYRFAGDGEKRERLAVTGVEFPFYAEFCEPYVFYYGDIGEGDIARVMAYNMETGEAAEACGAVFLSFSAREGNLYYTDEQGRAVVGRDFGKASETTLILEGEGLYEGGYRLVETPDAFIVEELTAQGYARAHTIRKPDGWQGVAEGFCVNQDAVDVFADGFFRYDLAQKTWTAMQPDAQGDAQPLRYYGADNGRYWFNVQDAAAPAYVFENNAFTVFDYFGGRLSGYDVAAVADGMIFYRYPDTVEFVYDTRTQKLYRILDGMASPSSLNKGKQSVVAESPGAFCITLYDIGVYRTLDILWTREAGGESVTTYTQEGMLQTLIRRAVLRGEAKKRGLTVSPQQARQAVKNAGSALEDIRIHLDDLTWQLANAPEGFITAAAQHLGILKTAFIRDYQVPAMQFALEIKALYADHAERRETDNGATDEEFAAYAQQLVDRADIHYADVL